MITHVMWVHFSSLESASSAFALTQLRFYCNIALSYVVVLDTTELTEMDSYVETFTLNFVL